MTLRKPLWWAAACLSIVVGAGLSAQTAPSLSATAHQVRERANEPFSIVPLWDTTWWISVDGHRGAAPLESVEYHARLGDSPDTRARAGRLDLPAADRSGFRGRIMVVCPTRPDYTRDVRVRLRVRDTDGAQSEWTEVQFPVKSWRTTPGPTPADAVQVTTEVPTERQHMVVGTVQVEVDGDTTIATVRSELLEKARAQGGDAAVGFRLVSSVGDHNTFAADVIRYVDPTPASVAAPAGAAPTPGDDSRVLGEITVPHGP